MGALKEAARKGRGGDTRLGHLTNGDVVIPAEHLDEPTKKLVHLVLKRKGLDPSRFTVGDKGNVRNPKTRLPQFEAGDTSASGGTGGSGPGSAGDPGGGSGAGGAVGGGSTAGDTSGSTTNNPGAQLSPGDLSSATAGGQLGVTGTGVSGVDAAQRAQEQASITDPSQIGMEGVGVNLGQSVQDAVNSFVGSITPGGILGAMLNGVVPGLGLVSGISGLLGGPTTGSVLNGGITALGGPSGPGGGNDAAGAALGDVPDFGGGVGQGLDDSILKQLGKKVA